MRTAGWGDMIWILTGLATLVKGEPGSDLGSDIVDEITMHPDVVTGQDKHTITRVRRQIKINGGVCCAYEQLRAIVIHETSGETTLLFRKELGIHNVKTETTANHDQDHSRRSGPRTCGQTLWIRGQR